MAGQLFSALVAIVLGVGVSILYFSGTNWALDTFLGDRRRPDGKLHSRETARGAIRPWLFVGPALLLLGVYLVYPVFETIKLSLFDRSGDVFVGIDNFIWALGDDEFLQSIWNNILWLLIVPAMSTIMGMIVAVLADKVRVGYDCEDVHLPANGDLLCRRQRDLEIRL